MNSAEFRQWWKHHATCFTAVSGWLGKFPKTARSDSDVTQRDIMESWEKTLSFTDLNDAISASDDLAAGTESFSDKGFDCHPRDVRRIAMVARGERHREAHADHVRRIIDGHETFRCVWCEDSGIKLVVHPRSIAAARDSMEVEVDGTKQLIPKLRHARHNPLGGFPIYSAAVACSCEAGSAKRDFLGAVFTTGRHLEWNDVDDQWNEIVEFANSASRGQAFDRSRFDYPETF